MNLKCVFHVSSASIRPAAASPQVTQVTHGTQVTQVTRARMPSLLDLDIQWVDAPEPRGTSHETWQRARGWASED